MDSVTLRWPESQMCMTVRSENMVACYATTTTARATAAAAAAADERDYYMNLLVLNDIDKYVFVASVHRSFSEM